jgi:hypothetical protein
VRQKECQTEEAGDRQYVIHVGKRNKVENKTKKKKKKRNTVRNFYIAVLLPYLLLLFLVLLAAALRVFFLCLPLLDLPLFRRSQLRIQDAALDSVEVSRGKGTEYAFPNLTIL